MYNYLINIDIGWRESRLSLAAENNLRWGIGWGAATHADVDVVIVSFDGVDEEPPQRWSEGSKNRILRVPLFNLSGLQIKRAVRCRADYTSILQDNVVWDSSALHMNTDKWKQQITTTGSDWTRKTFSD